MTDVLYNLTCLGLSKSLCGEVRADDLTSQADVYRGIARVCRNSAGCTAIQTWGFTDKYSRIRSHSRGTRGQALPFDRSWRPKADYRAPIAGELGGTSFQGMERRRC